MTLNERAGKALAGRRRCGMELIDPQGRRQRITGIYEGAVYVDGDFDPYDGAMPAMDDPATLGAILAIVREAWAAPFAQASPRMRMQPEPTCNGWRVYLNDASDREFGGATEAEALVAALESAPR
jgi:hypothetical protein